MEFGFMKRVDYWVGRPLCWMLTLWRKLIAPIAAPKKAMEPPKKILMMKPSELGAIILALPLIDRLKEQYPHAEISFLTFDGNRPLLEVTGAVHPDRILTLTDGSFGRFLSDVMGVIGTMKAERYDVVIDLEFFSRFTAILSYLSGAPKRVGFHRYSIEGVYRGDLLTHRIMYNPHQHVQTMYMHMISSLDKSNKNTPEIGRNESAPPSQWQFKAENSHVKAVEAKLMGLGVTLSDKLYLMAPGEGRIPLREWPLTNFAGLTNRILQDPAARIIVIGLEDPAGRAAGLMQSVEQPDRCHDLIGQTDLTELLTLFTLATAMVVNDSGLAHLASLTGIKQYVLFGPEHPNIFSPRGEGTTVFYRGLPCSPCLSVFNHRNSACRDNLCLKSITVDEVFAALVDN